MILGADNQEVGATVSDFDKPHVSMKARHVIDALQVLVTKTDSNTPFTWKEACIKLSIRNYKNVGWQTIIQWYQDMLTTTTGDLRFTRSFCGKSSSMACSPYAEDESLLVEFKSWAWSDLDKLTIKKAAEWVNKKVCRELSAK